ncbi:MAG: hypothetical protein LBF89_11630 [Bacteroidales bacterium]|jgi:hypothetical protein|nr:hypothetical protein [Bacteroidales bacterium]
MKALFIISCMTTGCLFSAAAQEIGSYSILSVTGKIIDKQTSQELVIGQKINLQTTLLFDIASDAVVLSPSKVKYRIALPAQHVMSSTLEIPSQQAIRLMPTRPILATGTRGSESLSADFSISSLKNYFGADTFSVIGNSLKLPIREADAKKGSLIVRYEKDGIKEIRLKDFTLDKAQLIPGGSHINECFILMDDGEQMQTVTQIRLFFVDENRLMKEFSALFRALETEKKDTPENRKILSQYCTDVYGCIDRKNLNSAVERFFRQ